MSRLALAAVLLTFAVLVHPSAAHALATCVDRAVDDAALAPAPVLVPAAPVGDDSLPWCVNADDPRCSPMPGGSLPPHVSVQPKVSWVSSISLPEPRATQLVTPRELTITGAPRDGAHARLDRPPR